MIRHMVAWNFREDMADSREEAAAKIKEIAEALPGKIPGLISLEIITNPMPTSTVDIILNSLLKSQEALSGYQVHPEHVRLGNYIKTVTCNRVCFDYCE